ncbi:MAG: M23 family metallopeptidase [Bacteroidales bacterium]|nr:M23 family metallopeptidase [Bacteroidales bacterium]
MGKFSKYIYNPETLLYEKKEDSKVVRVLKVTGFAFCVAAVVALNFIIYTQVLGLDLPKTAHLKKKNAEWQAKFEVLNHSLDVAEKVLGDIEQRDDDVYRSIFGLEEIPEEVKQAGFGGVNRYAYLDDLGGSSYLKNTVRRLDIMTKRSFLQSTALDEVAMVSHQAGNLISCVPAVSPIIPETGKYRISSPFGRRSDPVHKSTVAFHEGIDFATSLGNPVYSTGDGVVERVRYQFFGYGNEVVIDHGFGYKTRYAHLNSIDVAKGQTLKRGQKIGTVGNTGKSTGPHLHYEVIYKGKQINPSPFMDLSIKPEEYKSMVRTAADEQL